jgi:hypothetical protein
MILHTIGKGEFNYFDAYSKIYQSLRYWIVPFEYIGRSNGDSNTIPYLTTSVGRPPRQWIAHANHLRDNVQLSSTRWQGDLDVDQLQR